MKNHLLLLTSLVLILVGSSSSFAQWSQTGNFYGGYYRALCVSGSNVYAGNWGGGIYQYNNDGKSWTNLPLEENALTAIVASPDGKGGTSLFVSEFGLVSPNIGVFRSTDNGQSWTKVISGLTNLNVNALAVLPNDEGVANLLAGTWGSGVFLSKDNGDSWTQIDSGLTWTVEPGATGLDINALAVSPTAGGGNTILAGTTAGIFRSTNNGAYWTHADSGLTPNIMVASLGVSADQSRKTNVFAGDYSGSIYLSTDDGSSWTQVDSGLNCPELTTFAFSSNGSGETNVFAGSYGGGIFLSTNNGASWTGINTGLGCQYVCALAAAPDGQGGTNIFAGTWGDGIYLSTNEGTSWTAIDTGLIDQRVMALTSCTSNTGDTILFAGTFNNGLYLSTDAGNTWIRDNKGILFAGSGALTTCPNGNGGMTILFGGAGLYVSTNYGASWNRINSVQANINAFASSSNGQTSGGIFAGGNASFGSGAGGEVFLSTDIGQSWRLLGSKIGIGIAALAFYDNHLFAGTPDGVFLTTDSCATWTPCNTGLTDTCIMALTCYPNNTSGMKLFASTPSGIFLSTNDGGDWVPVVSDSISTQAQALAVSQKHLFAGTSTIGVWKRPLSELTNAVKNVSSNIPQKFQLLQNYPNPFNPSTVISYQLSRNSLVVLKVFDVLGREVGTMVNERQTAGRHSATFNASNPPSGVYFYRLNAGPYHDTKKMLLLK